MRQDTNLSTISPAQPEWPSWHDGEPMTTAELMAWSLLENARIERWLIARQPKEGLDAQLAKCGRAYDRVRRGFLIGVALVACLMATSTLTACVVEPPRWMGGRP